MSGPRNINVIRNWAFSVVCRQVFFSCLVAGTTMVSTWAVPTSAATSISSPGLESIEESLSPHPGDPLSPFRLSLGASYEAVREVVGLRRQGRLGARGDIYVHAALEKVRESGTPLLPAPEGLRVVDGDLFFHQGGKSPLMEASLLVKATFTTDRAITVLEQWLGKPDFEVVLPGSMNLAVGWRTPGAYLLATFSDLDVFQLSAFCDQPSDLLAGSQIVLFEGLSQYSRQVDAGVPPAETRDRLEEVVRWVETARKALHVVR